jgi:tRNA modification GTPase
MIEGVPFVFCDTAGITITEDKVEQIGIERAKQRLSWADLTLFIVDGTSPSADWQSEFEAVRAMTQTIPVVNKADIAPLTKIPAENALYISAKTGQGCDVLQQILLKQVQERAVDSGESNQIVTNERHRDCLAKALRGIQASTEAIRQSLPAELVSAELRSALLALEELIGRTETEDILGRIFSKFCIGK